MKINAYIKLLRDLLNDHSFILYHYFSKFPKNKRFQQWMFIKWIANNSEFNNPFKPIIQWRSTQSVPRWNVEQKWKNAGVHRIARFARTTKPSAADEPLNLQPTALIVTNYRIDTKGACVRRTTPHWFISKHYIRQHVPTFCSTYHSIRDRLQAILIGFFTMFPGCDVT